MKKATDKEIGQDLLRGIENQFLQALLGDDEGATLLKVINKKLMAGESFSLSFGAKISLDAQRIGSTGARIKFSTPTELKAIDFEIDVSGQPKIDNGGKTIDEPNGKKKAAAKKAASKTDK